MPSTDIPTTITAQNAPLLYATQIATPGYHESILAQLREKEDELRLIFQHQIDTSRFRFDRPVLYRRETRLVFRTDDSSLLLTALHAETVNNIKKPGASGSFDEVGFQQSWRMSAWTTLRDPLDFGNAFSNQAYRAMRADRGLLRTSRVALTEYSFRMMPQDVLFHTFKVRSNPPSRQLDAEEVLSLFHLVTAGIAQFNTVPFNVAEVTGLAPEGWHHNARDQFWIQLPLESLQGIARTRLYGKDMPYVFAQPGERVIEETSDD